MRVPELLAPAGGMDALLAAVAAGADAVYTGLGAFSARAASAGLSMEELARACGLARARGVRVYVALNALLTDDGLGAALELARRAFAAGADALIVADLGLLRALARELPDAELHLSTQVGAQSAEAVALAARELGCSRVTLARELSVDEVSAACAAGVPVEAFCHGAICVCYSGACAFSALRRGRSANRGDCTQPCRMGYTLEDGAGAVLAGGPQGASCGGDRLLCPRDFLGLRHVARLAAAGVASLKIEGRMKNPDYVFNVVRCYREALDAVAAGRAFDADALERRLARSFNRGFTDAYLRGARGPGLDAGFMSSERSINQGARVGHLAEQCRDEAVLALDAPVDAGDVLEIRSTPGEHTFPGVPKRWPQVAAPVDALAGEALRVHCKRRVEPGSPVHVVRSARLIAEADAAVRAMRCELDASDAPAGKGGAGESLAGRPAAVNAAGRVGRADGGEPVSEDGGGAVRPTGGGDSLAALYPAVSAEDARRALASGADEVGVYAWRLEDPGAKAAWEPVLPLLAVVLDEVFRPGDARRVRELCGCGRAVVCRNIGQIDVVRGMGVPWEAAAPVNVWNVEAARWLSGLGCRRIWLPDELAVRDAAKIAQAMGGAAACGRFIGPCQLMVTEHCLLAAEGPCDGACPGCSRRAAASAGNRHLVDGEGARLAVEVDVHGRTRIFLEG